VAEEEQDISMPIAVTLGASTMKALTMQSLEYQTAGSAWGAAPITVNSRDSVRSLVTQYPELEPVFESFKLDVDNLGWLSLRTLVAGEGLDLEVVQAACRAAIAEAESASIAQGVWEEARPVLQLPARRALRRVGAVTR
jgi:hypothetical protein